MTFGSQILGAFFGIIYADFCMDQPEYLYPSTAQKGCITYDSFGQIFLLEFWCTLFFVTVILCQIHSNTQESNNGILHAAAISFTLLAMIETAGTISVVLFGLCI
jgi:glycerol uptake facilitator-like aquaporin